VVLGMVVVAGIAIMLLRRPGSLTHSSLFAEDGAIFFAQSHTLSFPSALATSYAGYLHAAPRIIASAATWLPLSWTPRAYTISALVICVLALTPALSERLAWLIPSVAARCALFLLLVVLPGVEDIQGVIANLQWWFGITFILLALSDDPRTWIGRIGEPLALVVLGVTGPFCILMAPLFWLRLWVRRSPSSAVAAAIVTATAVLQGVVLLLSHDQGGHPGPVTVHDLYTAWIYRYGGTAVFGQAGLRALWFADALNAVTWAVAAGFLFLAAMSLRWVPRRAAFVLVFAAVVALISMVVRLRHDVVVLGDPITGGRYYVGPIAVIAIGLVAAVSRVATVRTDDVMHRLAGFLPILPAVLLLQGSVLDVRLPPRGDIHWDDSVRCIESHRQCTVQLEPAGWTATLPPL
jgi:hypothetical protein